MTLFHELQREKLVAILRNVPEDKLDDTIESLAEGGLTFIEITLNSPGALKAIDRWQAKKEERLHIGAGTVLNLSMAKEAVSAGARYLITPNLDESVVAYGKKYSIDVWPGVMTPTEMVRAQQAGAEAVKLFPAGALGPRYLKDVLAPLNDLPVIATGGIDEHNLGTFFDAGACAAGIGSSLTDSALIHQRQFSELTANARRYVSMAKQERERREAT